jgi:hypothetical protein
MTRSEFEFLSPGAKGHAPIRIGGSGEIHEGLMDLESVLVGQAWPADAPRLDATLKLREDADVPSGMSIGVKQVALQEEPVRRIGNASE